jgi:peptide-methionine (S)-S-oxide reductase
MDGVVRTRVGYTGGTTADPTYHRLGDHTESIEVDYDPAVVGYEELLDLFWLSHTPRSPLHSRQYRSAIFYRTDEERIAAEASRERVAARVGQVFTDIEPFDRFYRAEDYHQKYSLRSRHSIMSEFRAMYPDDHAFVDSTAAARVNGWLGGCRDPSQIDRDLPRVGLSREAQAEVRRIVMPHRESTRI